MAPAPVGSGVSFRELPEARLLEVRVEPGFPGPTHGIASLTSSPPRLPPQVVKCCQHYESKCAGRYPASSPAARCVELTRGFRVEGEEEEEGLERMEMVQRDRSSVQRRGEVEKGWVRKVGWMKRPRG